MNNNLREKLIYIINKVGINDKIMSVANKMNIDIVRLFFDKIYNCTQDKIDENIDVVCKSLLGVYGNYIATTYFEALGYKTVNEFPIMDSNNNLLTKADIAFYDNDNILNLCEVKMSHQILDNIRNYVDLDEYNKGSYTDKDLIIIKYKNIGKKLLKQVEKLSKTGAKVNVITFDGCYIDDIILSKLKKMKVENKIINVNIDELENELNNMIYEVYENLKKGQRYSNSIK